MKRKLFGRYTPAELAAITNDPASRALLALEEQAAFDKKVAEANEPKMQQTGREGLTGPSELGVTPTGEFLAVTTLGGGYYFVPPIPNKDVSQIGQPYLAPASALVVSGG